MFVSVDIELSKIARSDKLSSQR